MEKIKTEIIKETVRNYVKNNSFKIKINLKSKYDKIDFLKLSNVEIYHFAKNLFKKLDKNKFINNNEFIYVSNADVKESIGKIIRNREQKYFLKYHILVFENLDKIVENGILISKDKEKKNRIQYIGWNYYITPIMIDNIKYIVEFDVVLRNDNEKHLRLERIYCLKELKTDVPDRED